MRGELVKGGRKGGWGGVGDWGGGAQRKFRGKLAEVLDNFAEGEDDEHGEAVVAGNCDRSKRKFQVGTRPFVIKNGLKHGKCQNLMIKMLQEKHEVPGEPET